MIKNQQYLQMPGHPNPVDKFTNFSAGKLYEAPPIMAHSIIMTRESYGTVNTCMQKPKIIQDGKLDNSFAIDKTLPRLITEPQTKKEQDHWMKMHYEYTASLIFRQLKWTYWIKRPIPNLGQGV